MSAKQKTNKLLEKSIKNLRKNLDELSMDNFKKRKKNP